MPFPSLKRLHLQHNQIRTIPFLKVLQGRQIVQEYSKTALKRKQVNARKNDSFLPLHSISILFIFSQSSNELFSTWSQW